MPPFHLSFATLAIFTNDQTLYMASHGYAFCDGSYWYSYIGSYLKSVVYSSDTFFACYNIYSSQWSYSFNYLTNEAKEFPNYYLDNPSFQFYSDLTPQLEPLDQNFLTPDTFCSLPQYTVSKSSDVVLFFNTGSTNTQSVTSAFTATANCGYPSPVFTYSGINDFDKNSPLPAFISVSPTTGQVTVQSTSVVGSYKVKYVGTLQNKQEVYIMIDVTISASGNNPYSSDIWRNQQIFLRDYFSKCLNCNLHSSSGSQVTIPNVQLQAVTTSWYFSSGNLYFHPDTMADVGYHIAQVTLQEGSLQVVHQFKIKVINRQPYFQSSLPTNITTNFGVIQYINLPAIIDPEGLAVYLNIQSGPFYVTKVSNSQLKILPTNCKTDFGDKVLFLSVEDDEHKSISYSIAITVDNVPPKLLALPQNQSVGLNNIWRYSLPDAVDFEGCMVRASYEAASLILPIVSLSGSTFTFNPTSSFQVGTHNITVIITDDGGASAYYWFTLRVVGYPKFVSPLIKKIDTRINSIEKYTLPIDPDENYLVQNNIKPNYCQFDKQTFTYTFTPKTVKDQFENYIKGYLDNGFNILRFEIKVNVLNDPPFLTGGPPNNQYVLVGNQVSITLSQYEDRENLPIAFSTYQDGFKGLPGFMKYDKQSRTYTIAPTKSHKLGEYLILIKLTDKLQAVKQYKFLVTIYDINHINSEDLLKGDGKNSTTYNTTLVKAKIQIRALSRDGVCVIKIVSKQYAEDVVKLINNQSFQIDIITQNNTRILYDINNKNIDEVTIKLKFPNPKSVSSSSELDKIQISVPKRVTFREGSVIVMLLEGQNEQKLVPPQLSSDMESVASSFRNGNIEVVKNTYLNFFMQASSSLCQQQISSLLIQLLWSRFDDLSFLTINTMISLTVPGIAQILQQVLMSLIYLDILLTDHWMPQLLLSINGQENEQIEINQPLNSYFDENGFQSIYFLRNIGSAIVYLGVYILLWLFFIILNLYNRFDPRQNFSQIDCYCRISKFVDRVRNILMWNMTLQLVSSQYVPFVMSSVINLYDVSINELNYIQINFKTPIMKISAILSLILLPLFLGCLLFNFLIVYYNRNISSDTDLRMFQRKYSQIEKDLRQSIQNRQSILIPYWNFIYLLRWTVTIAILTGLKDYPTVQILILLLISVVLQVLTIMAWPYENIWTNRICFFNEFMNSLYLYTILTLTDIQENKQRDVSSQCLLYIVVVTVLANLLKAFVKDFYNIASFIQEKFKKAKIASVEKEIPQQQSQDQIVQNIDFYELYIQTGQFKINNDFRNDQNQIFDRNANNQMQQFIMNRPFNQKQIQDNIGITTKLDKANQQFAITQKQKQTNLKMNE